MAILPRPQPGFSLRNLFSSQPDHALARHVAVAGTAALAAGAIHVGEVASHSNHRQAVWAFLGLAVVQLVWGALALARPRRWVAATGIVIGAFALAGWAVAARYGISFIDGLERPQATHWADALAAILAGVTMVACAAALLVRRPFLAEFWSAVWIVAILALAFPATASTLDAMPATATAATKTKTVVVRTPATPTKQAIAPKLYDPTKPIDLSGVPGVTPAEQARAENLLSATILLLPQWKDPTYDEKHGFFSIGDGVTGVEHYLNPTFMNDNTILDPDRPESLVFDTTVQPKKLVAVMFMLKPGATLASAPDIGGPLTQFHIHNNLCFNKEGKVAGLTDGQGGCRPGLTKGVTTPMIHVWIEPHKCGPFAALEGIGGGQIASGESVACDHVHGAASS